MAEGATATPTAPKLTLPPDEAAMVREAYAGADVILEYGSGGSTVLGASLPGRAIVSVESDRAWARRVDTWIRSQPAVRAVTIHHADIGKTGKWGRPLDNSAWARFHHYPLAVWDLPGFDHPDVVLVDGRFRVACFLATLFRIERPVALYFDDYADRPYYHVVERYAQPAERRGRMVRFDLSPMTLPARDLAWVMDVFRHIR